LRRIGNDSDWLRLAVGGEGAHTLAIKSDGSLWGWGQNIYGQLGEDPRIREQRYPATVAAGNDWSQAAVGGSHSLALKRDGSLWAWGNNWAGQLGIGSTNSHMLGAVQVGELRVVQPVQVSSETNWVKVWAGLLESVAMKSDGTLWYWGDNPNPAIPQSQAGSSNIFIPTRISADTDWVELGFGPWTVLALKSDGTLWAWGREAHNFTGVEDQSRDAIPTRVGKDADWKAICPSGFLYQLLQKRDGSLWSMVAETGGMPKPRLTRIDLKNEVIAFASRGNSERPTGVILTRDGEVWTWGKILGAHTQPNQKLQTVSKALEKLHWRNQLGKSKPMIRQKAWLLPNEG